MLADELSDLEIAVLCDLLERLVELAKDDPAKFQLSDKAHHLLAERGVGISGG
jgi:hypothetical protein